MGRRKLGGDRWSVSARSGLADGREPDVDDVSGLRSILRRITEGMKNELAESVSCQPGGAARADLLARDQQRISAADRRRAATTLVLLRSG